MATQKNYIWNNGQLEESNYNIDMLGWEYTQDGFTKRIVNESTGIYNHSKYAESKYIIQVLVGGNWVTASNEVATVSMDTYCQNTAPYAPVSKEDAFEEVDDLTKPQYDEEGNIIGYAQKKVLKSTVAIEWEFYYPVFFNPNSSGANLYNFVKHGAEIKTGITL